MENSEFGCSCDLCGDWEDYPQIRNNPEGGKFFVCEFCAVGLDFWQKKEGYKKVVITMNYESEIDGEFFPVRLVYEVCDIKKEWNRVILQTYYSGEVVHYYRDIKTIEDHVE